MIIDFFRQLIFIHIPKTGGTAIHEWLTEQYVKSTATTDTPIVNLWGFQNGLDLAHLTLYQAQSIISDFPIKFIKIAVVRSPYDRIYSAYQQPYLQKYPKLTFVEFLDRFVGQIKDKRIEYDQTKIDPELIHIWPMCSFITINGNNSVDFVVRFEDWDRDIDYLRSRFKLTGRPPVLNQSTKCPGFATQNQSTKCPGFATQNATQNQSTKCRQSRYLSKYTPEQIQLINQVYQDDFEWFSYEKI